MRSNHFRETRKKALYGLGAAPIHRCKTPDKVNVVTCGPDDEVIHIKALYGLGVAPIGNIQVLTPDAVNVATYGPDDEANHLSCHKCSGSAGSPV